MGYRIQATSINVARAVYALNWFNIAPGLKYIASDFRFQIIQLGIITTAFYIGLSTFQMVGGLLSGRIGNKNTAVLGIAILGVSVITTGLSGNLFELFVSRLFAGIGSALFFSPALGLLADIVPKGSYSFYVGMFNGSFNLGGGVGIIGWALLDQVYGWRAPLVLAGIIMLSIALENLV
ncbi:MAG: MFS transporter, partial [Candidatus Thermoplasmatota archaeon]|nr:MFS transporter [Candidatus Thermoplasmatota archaeon]